MSRREDLGLDNDDLIVLFEWAHRFCETNKLAFSDPAEAVVIDKIAAELERSLPEPFLSTYSDRLAKARRKVLKAYEDRMGAETWIHELSLDQV